LVISEMINDSTPKAVASKRSNGYLGR
jgi:hypothetical protein